MRRNPEPRTDSRMPRERVVLLILLVLVSLAAGIVAWNNSRSANELNELAQTPATTPSGESTPGEPGSSSGSGATGSASGSSTGTSSAGTNATGAATPSASGAGTGSTPGDASGTSAGTRASGEAPTSGTPDPSTAPATGAADSGVAVQPSGAVDVPSIPAFGETATGNPAGTQAEPAPTPGGINPDTALATLPGVNPFRPLALDEREGGVSSATPTPAAPTPTVPAVTAPPVTAVVRPPLSSPSSALSGSGNRLATAAPVASRGRTTSTGSTGNGGGASTRPSPGKGGGSSATPVRTTPTTPIPAPIARVPTTPIRTTPAPITPIPRTADRVTVNTPVTTGGAFPTLPGARRDVPRADTVTVTPPPITPPAPTAITRPPGGTGTASPVTPLPAPGRPVPTPLPAPVRPPIAGVRVPSENIDLNSTLARGPGSAAGASGTPGSTTSAGATSPTALPTPGTPQPITQLGGDSAAAPLTALDRVIQNQEITLNAAVLGPVNTAILRSKDGFAVVAVGQKLPDSDVVLQEVTADSVTLALGNDTTTLQLSDR